MYDIWICQHGSTWSIPRNNRLNEVSIMISVDQPSDFGVQYVQTSPFGQVLHACLSLWRHPDNPMLKVVANFVAWHHCRQSAQGRKCLSSCQVFPEKCVSETKPRFAGNFSQLMFYCATWLSPAKPFLQLYIGTKQVPFRLRPRPFLLATKRLMERRFAAGFIGRSWA